MALKKISKQLIINTNASHWIQREIEVHCRLDYKHVAKIYGYYLNDTKIVIVEEFCDGPTLFEFLSESSKHHRDLSHKEIVDYAHQTLKALKYLHSKGVMHRDIKLENILTKNG